MEIIGYVAIALVGIYTLWKALKNIWKLRTHTPKLDWSERPKKEKKEVEGGKSSNWLHIALAFSSIALFLIVVGILILGAYHFGIVDPILTMPTEPAL